MKTFFPNPPSPEFAVRVPAHGKISAQVNVIFLNFGENLLEKTAEPADSFFR
jgi:hypothetical protein